MGEDKLLERIRRFQNGEDVGLKIDDYWKSREEMIHHKLTIGEQCHRVLVLSPLFRDLSVKKMDEYLTLLHAEYTIYKEGDILHQAGEKMEKFGFVLSGHVQACCDDLDGNRVIMAEVGRAVTFGESIHFLHLENEPVYIEATKETRMLWMSLYDVLDNPTNEACADILCRFLSILSNRTMVMHDRIVLLSQHSTREKILLYLNLMSKKEGLDTFLIPLSREDMADYLGVNRSALSRELSKMQEEGIITFYMNEFTLLRKQNE